VRWVVIPCPAGGYSAWSGPVWVIPLTSHADGTGSAQGTGLSPARVIVAVRDSKDPRGPVLAVAHAGWRDFIADVKAGQHDLT
jgi:hypothetical protein